MICEYFSKCNGCTSQHLSYEQQLEGKLKAVKSATGFNEINVFASKPFSYRNRLEFSVKDSIIGLRGNSGVINIENCPIADERINDLLSEIRNYFKYDLEGIRYIVIRATKVGDSGVWFVLKESYVEAELLIEKIKDYAQLSTSKNVIITFSTEEIDRIVPVDESIIVKGRDLLEESLAGNKFSFPMQGFFQNNSGLAEEMHKYIHSLLKKDNCKEKHLLDLYAGVGTFGIINSDLFSTVMIVESVGPAIKAADLNLVENKVKNAKTYALDANKLKRLKFSFPLIVITDPPRIGMDEKTILQLKELKPEKIIYISCNLQQLKKDLLKFKNYRLKSVALFDFFPQTWHCETVVELERN